MPVNSDKPHLWKQDIATSVDHFNRWFLESAPQAFRTARLHSVGVVKRAFDLTNGLRTVTPAVLAAYPGILPTLRMATAPPIARDRVMGLAAVSRNLVESMDKRGRLPLQMPQEEVSRQLANVCVALRRLFDADVSPWLAEGGEPSEPELNRAATIVADRLCGSVSDPIIRNSQEQRQLAVVERFLVEREYRRLAPPPAAHLRDMARGTFAFRLNVPVGQTRKINVPVDIVVQSRVLRPNGLPVLIEAKSAGDFTNTNKRRKEEATKIRQLRDAYGPDTCYVLLLCGYFDSGYLGYEAAEGLDWIWEHRIEDLMQLGVG